jgi:hypothetical protein
MPEEDTIGGIIQKDLDQLPLLPADRWIPRKPPTRGPLQLTRLTSAVAVVLALILALGIGQGVRGLRERSAATQSPDTVSSAGASAIVPPHLASPDSIAVVYETKVTIRSDQAVSTASVAVIDSQTGAIRYEVPAAAGAQGVFRAAGNELVVIDWPRAQGLRVDVAATEQRIRLIDARTGTINATLTEPRQRAALGQWPALGAAVSPDGKVLALQQLGTPGLPGAEGRSQAGQVDVLTYYNLETRGAFAQMSTPAALVFTPNCGPGQLGFTDDGRDLFLMCSTGRFFVMDAGTRNPIAVGALPPRRGTFPGVGGMVVVGSTATVVSADGQDRYLIRTDGNVGSTNLGQMFPDAIVPPGAIARVPRQARVLVGYGPAMPATVVNDARIMDAGSSGGRFSITRSSVGGLLADDRGNLFGADTDGSIWRRGSTTVSDDVTLVPGTPGRLARLLTVMRTNAPTILSRDQAIKFVNARNIRIDRIDRIEAKLNTFGEVLANRTSGPVVMEGVDPATPVWAIAVRGEMHNIRGLIDLGGRSAIFVIDAQTGEPIAFLASPDEWPAGFDALLDRAPAATAPSTSPRLPSLGGSTPIGDISARSACDGKLGSARLVAAFESTAGVVADWVENVAYPDAPHVVSSDWRRLAPSAPAYVCYFDGQFNAPGGPAPGASIPPLLGRALILIDSSGMQLGPAKYGPSDSLPLARPGGRF